MSEPVTHAEIEDVLSSIRRLVSETGRDAADASPAPEHKKPATRLVLTPALRVAPGDEARAGSDKADGANIFTEAAAPATGATGQSKVLPMRQGVGPVAEPVKAAGAPDTAIPTPQLDVGTPDVALDDAPWRDPNARLFDVVRGVSTPEAGADQASESAAASTSDAPPQTEQSQTEMSPRQQSPKIAAVVRRIAELETARREIQASERGKDVNEDEIDAVPPVRSEVETLVWEDHVAPTEVDQTYVEKMQLDPAQAAAKAPLDSLRLAEAAVAEEAIEKAERQASAGEADFLDEGSLRDLVAEIVRQELQGPLGERITRNVRKLVRREIQRSLAAEDLL